MEEEGKIKEEEKKEQGSGTQWWMESKANKGGEMGRNNMKMKKVEEVEVTHGDEGRRRGGGGGGLVKEESEAKEEEEEEKEKEKEVREQGGGAGRRCTHLYCGGGLPSASQVKVARCSGELTGRTRSLGSALHLGPWNVTSSVQAEWVGEEIKNRRRST